MEIRSQDCRPDGCSLNVTFPDVTGADLFNALTDPSRLTTWWPPEATVDDGTPGWYVFSWPSMNWTLRGQYEHLSSDHLRFTWSWDHEDLPDRIVDISVSANTSSGSDLNLAHTAGSEDEAQSYLDGWIHFFGVLDTQPWLSD